MMAGITRGVISWLNILSRLRWQYAMYMHSMPSSNGNIFHVTGPLWKASTGYRWFPLTKASDAELWIFLWSAHEQTVEQTNKKPVIWDAIALISFWRHGNDRLLDNPGNTSNIQWVICCRQTIRHSRDIQSKNVSILYRFRFLYFSSTHDRLAARN